MKGLDVDGARTPRQRELIDVAARLFAERGYHAVGINDVSGQLGLTGPAFYRHYSSKEALLVDLLDHTITTHLEQVRDLVSAHPDPWEALDALLSHHLDFVFDRSAELRTWRTEFRVVPEADRQRLRYLQRLHTEEWVRVARRLRTELADDEIRALCHAALAVLQSPTEFPSRLPRAQLSPLLKAAAARLLT